VKSFPNPTDPIFRSSGAAARGPVAGSIIVLVGLTLLAVSCSGPGDAARPVTTTASTTVPATASVTSDAASVTTADTTTTTSTTTTASTTPSTTVGSLADWVRHASGDDCRCVDGSEHAIHTRAGDPTKVLLYFQGGGACVNAVTCDPISGTYKSGTWPDDHPNAGWSGIFAVDEPRNPFNGWTYVFVPYCSADFFLGDETTTHGGADGVAARTIEHRGANTLRRALDLVVGRYGDLEQLVVAGTSAGAVPTPLVAALASDALPHADIAVLADGAGGYPSAPSLNEFLAEFWGTAASVPAWPELAEIDIAGWGIPDLFEYAARHDPTIRMARFDDIADEVQLYFVDILVGAASSAGHPVEPIDGDLASELDRNERRVETAGVELDVYLAPGGNHTVLDQPRLYDLEVDGVALVDWITRLATGRDAGDVRCPNCR
jgi:hypothetical protein